MCIRDRVIERRLAKAEYEMSFSPQYDLTVVNDDLATAVEQVRRAILDFIS